MKIDDIDELHYIAPICNVKSIFTNGLLSHGAAQKVNHESVAMAEIQERREGKIVPGGYRLHDYVNLYINARNKMLYKIKDKHETLCVLRINKKVMKLPDVVIADQNASSDYVRFAPAPDGLNNIDGDLVFAKYWTHPEDQIEEWRHGSKMCAEVLVPHRIAPQFILGVSVSCDSSMQKLESLKIGLNIIVNPELFFVE